MRTARRKVLRARTALACAFVASSLLLAGSLESWGIRREFAAVDEARAGISRDLTTVSAQRESLTTVDALIAQLDSIGAARRSWSSVIAAVTGALPPESYLHALTASGDSVVLDGVAESVEAVRRSLGLMPGAVAVLARTPGESTWTLAQPLVPFRFVVRLNTRPPDREASSAATAATSVALPLRIQGEPPSLAER